MFRFFDILFALPDTTRMLFLTYHCSFLSKPRVFILPSEIQQAIQFINRFIMPTGILYKWEENNHGLDHKCGTCATVLSSPRAKKTCFGKHEEVCTR